MREVILQRHFHPGMASSDYTVSLQGSWLLGWATILFFFFLHPCIDDAMRRTGKDLSTGKEYSILEDYWNGSTEESMTGLYD